MFSTLLLNGINATFFFLFYSAFVERKIEIKKYWWKFIIFITIMVLFAFFSKGHIAELYRLPTMLIICALLLSIFLEKKIFSHIPVVLMSYFLAFAILALCAAIMSTVFVSILKLDIENLDVRNLITLILYFPICIITYNKIKSPKVLHLFKEFLKSKEIQALTIILSIITFASIFYWKLQFTQIESTDLLVYTIFYACVIIGSIIVGVSYVKRYRENKKNQNEKLLLEKSLEELIAKDHTNSKVFPTAIATLDELLGKQSDEELEEALKTNGKTIMELINIYLGEERRRFKEDQQNVELPTTSWTSLNKLLKKYYDMAIKKSIHLKIDIPSSADVNLLDEMGISPLDVQRVIADHLDNSIKEIGKSKDRRGVINLYFEMFDGVYEIRIEDNAHEFPLHILADLGERKVSTNGTGDGFANTLNTLSLYNASLIIREFAPENECLINKAIAFRFDGLAQFKIESYRADKIEKISGKSKAIIEKTLIEVDKTPQIFENLNRVLSVIFKDKENIS